MNQAILHRRAGQLPPWLRHRGGPVRVDLGL